MGRKFEEEKQGEEPQRSKTFIDWKGVFTQASRNAIPEDRWYNLENLIPLGPANLHTVANISAPLANFGSDTVYFVQYVNVNGVDYEMCFSAGGNVYAYNIASQAVTTIGTGLSGAG